MKKVIYLFLFLSFYPLLSFGQSQTVRNLIEQVNQWRVFFLYPSTLRMIDAEEKSTYKDFIRDIEIVKIIRIDSSHKDFSKINVDNITRELASEEFVPLIQVKLNPKVIEIAGKYESIKNPTTVAIINETHTFLLIEIEGKVDLDAGLELLNRGFDISKIGDLVQPKSQ